MPSFDPAGLDPEALEASQILWTFNGLERHLARADIILLMGSNDLAVAGVAADLAVRHPGAVIICSGGRAHQSDLLSTGWRLPEADVFADALIGLGIAPDRILRERHARNTAENVTFSRALGPAEVSDVYVVQKPFMCLRAYLTTRRHWPGVTVGVAHEQIGFIDYLRRYGRRELIDIIVGDTERIMRYPEQGFFDPVPVPDGVRQAFDRLVCLGYVRHLIEKRPEPS
jgi:uncharacterized SAM-binding protein YcdF (DUF218 family)